MSLPIVCIIGRPNVGKSTLFNRILRRRQAVVDPTPGVTRDRHYAVAEWAGRSFALVDTGGLILQSDEEMTRAIADQARLAIEEADLVLLILDGTVTVHPDDAAIARLVLRSGKPSVMAINKIDDERRDADVYEFARLGPIEPIGISAMNGRAIGDLLDLVITALPPMPEPMEAPDAPIHLAIVGRPNVGKSSLVNRLLGASRMIVSPVPGTTRDAVDTALESDGRQFVLIDTGGLRKAARVTDQIEFYTALRSIRAIQRADVVCVLLDASQELSVQDLRIATMAADSGCGVFFGVNKWDLIEKDTDTAGAYAKDLQARAQTFGWVPVLFLSALTGQRAARTLEFAATIAAERLRHIPTPELNQTVLADITAKPPPAVKGRFIKIHYVTQAPEPPPTFVIFGNHPELIGAPYERYVINRLRERYGFAGVPIRLRWRKRGR
ncbi:MAG: ribosome biogenesis GTPase Der [Candidatus Zixiibacteriota bacterium]